jgi:hypothetical protein
LADLGVNVRIKLEWIINRGSGRGPTVNLIFTAQ